MRAPSRSDSRAPAERGSRGDRIGIGGGDDSVTRIQLAARWAEAYGSDKDTLTTILNRSGSTYDYLDAVTHGVEPPQLPVESRSEPASAPAAAVKAPAQC